MRSPIQSTRFAPALLIAALMAATPAAAGDFRLERTLSLAPGGVVDFKTDAGRVIVRGTARDDVYVVVTSDDSDVEDNYEFRFEEAGGRVVIRVERRGSFVRRWFDWKDTLQFDIEVPRRVDLAMAATRGTAAGELDLDIPRVGDLEISTSGGRISVRDIDGNAQLHTSGGRIELESITGTVDASTSGGSISAADLGARAELSTSGGSISVERIAGDLSAETSGGSIKITAAGGRVEADTSGGSVTASFVPGNSAGGSLSSSGGRITAYLDAATALDLDATTSGGSVTVDLPITIQGKMSRRAVRGSLNGGGALLRLHTSGGGVSVRPL